MTNIVIAVSKNKKQFSAGHVIVDDAMVAHRMANGNEKSSYQSYYPGPLKIGLVGYLGSRAQEYFAAFADLSQLQLHEEVENT